MIVAAAQIAPGTGAADTVVAERALREATARGAELVVLPELAVAGSGSALGRLRRLSADLHLVVVAGLSEVDDDGRWNAAVVIEDGEIRGRYRKAHLWGEEKTRFAAAADPPLVVGTRVGRLGVMICYDLEFPEWPRLAAQAGAEILAVPANWPRNHHRGQYPVEVAKAQAAAAAYGIFVVVADRHGVEEGQDWEGCSLVCGPDGYLLAGPATAPGDPAGAALVVATLDPALARDKTRGPYNDVMQDRRPSLYT